ncbi:hypothetical protein NHL51_09030 [Leucobacter sp. gxy201]|uniref:hypothetical protein n=1 Tax=Leucobacter sp. gxy201 TaxID=2957200 RepID=UPI003DA1A91F
MNDADGAIDGPADTGPADAEATRVVPSRVRREATDTEATRVVPARVRRDTTGAEAAETDAGATVTDAEGTGTDAEATRIVPSRVRGADPGSDGPTSAPGQSALGESAPGSSSGAQTRSRSTERSRSRSASASRRGILERAVGTTGPGPGPVPEPEIALPAGLGSPTVPRAYGARQIPVGGAEHPDAVQQRLGAAPEPGGAGPGSAREGLPSVLKRSARDRAVTLVAYGAVIAISAAGLWAISRVVWG